MPNFEDHFELPPLRPNVFPATDWENIDGSHQRCKVFGGWLIKAYEDVVHNTEYSGRIPGWDWRIAMAFVPDMYHEWRLTDAE